MSKHLNLRSKRDFLPFSVSSHEGRLPYSLLLGISLTIYCTQYNNHLQPQQTNNCLIPLIQ